MSAVEQFEALREGSDQLKKMRAYEARKGKRKPKPSKAQPIAHTCPLPRSRAAADDDADTDPTSVVGL